MLGYLAPGPRAVGDIVAGVVAVARPTSTTCCRRWRDCGERGVVDLPRLTAAARALKAVCQ